MRTEVNTYFKNKGDDEIVEIFTSLVEKKCEMSFGDLVSLNNKNEIPTIEVSYKEYLNKSMNQIKSVSSKKIKYYTNRWLMRL